MIIGEYGHLSKIFAKLVEMGIKEIVQLGDRVECEKCKHVEAVVEPQSIYYYSTIGAKGPCRVCRHDKKVIVKQDTPYTLKDVRFCTYCGVDIDMFDGEGVDVSFVEGAQKVTCPYCECENVAGDFEEPHITEEKHTRVLKLEGWI